MATDALVSMEKAMKRDNIEVNDRQLACARIQSKEVLVDVWSIVVIENVLSLPNNQKAMD